MKKLFVIMLMFAFVQVNAQSKKQLLREIESLKEKISITEERLDSVKVEIDYLQSARADLYKSYFILQTRFNWELKQKIDSLSLLTQPASTVKKGAVKKGAKSASKK